MTNIYRIAGYFRTRKFRTTTNKLHFKVFIFILLKFQPLLANYNYIVNFNEFYFHRSDVLFEISKNKNPLKIIHYTVNTINSIVMLAVLLLTYAHNSMHTLAFTMVCLFKQNV